MRNKILQWVPLAVLLIAWEAYAKFQSGFSTMFSSPVRIITLLYEKTVSGDLPYHTFITAYESFVGLLFGLFIGCIIGFILVYFPKCSKIAHPYIIALSSIPTFGMSSFQNMRTQNHSFLITQPHWIGLSNHSN